MQYYMNQILGFSFLCASFILNNNIKEMRTKFKSNVTEPGSFITNLLSSLQMCA